MKNILTDSEIIERKMASLTPEQKARWQSPSLGLYAREIREEIKSNWIKEYRQEEMLGEYKENALEIVIQSLRKEIDIECERANHYREKWQNLNRILRKIEGIIQEDQIRF